MLFNREIIERFAAKFIKALHQYWVNDLKAFFVSSKNISNIERRFASTPLVVQQSTLLALLLFFAALTSSPSIFRGFTPDVISKATPLILVVMLALKGDYRLPANFLLAWGACFSLILVSGININLSSTNAAPAINSALIVTLILVLASQVKKEAFSQVVLEWWGRLFWIVSVCSIANWVLSQTLPSLFMEINFGELYEGNARSYLVSPFGAVVLQDYGFFALHRVTGILAEPGMMSMFFLVNATMSLFGKSSVFSSQFGLANLLAAFATHSVAFYFALSIVSIFYLLRRNNRMLQALVVCTICIMAFVNYGFIEETVQGLLERSSFDVREGDSDFLHQLIVENPLGSLFGYAWSGDYRQLPAAFPQLFYQTGLIGAISYAVILWFFLRGSLFVAIVVYIYGMSIDYQTFVIFPLLLLVIKANNEIFRQRHD